MEESKAGNLWNITFIVNRDGNKITVKTFGACAPKVVKPLGGSGKDYSSISKVC